LSRPANIVVTGGAGFIGSHLVERLLADGHRVQVIDDLSTGRLSNLAACQSDARLDVVVSTVSGCSDLPKLMREADCAYHLAAAVGVDLVVRHPIRTIETNLDETEAILKAASQNQSRVLVASTSEVYGKSPKPAFAEDDDLLIGPPHLARWSYACSKLMDEFLAMAYSREHHLPIIIARLFNTVGPRQTGQYGMVLPRFIQAAQKGRPLQVYGDGSQTRCFCDVQDTVEALVRLMICPEASGEVVNVGSDHEISIEHLARTIISLLDSSSTLEHVPYDVAYAPGFEDMLRRRPVIEKCRRLTGFQPSTTLETIIRRAAGARGDS
jgi:UDP-glucose 4-epimerase